MQSKSKLQLRIQQSRSMNAAALIQDAKNRAAEHAAMIKNPANHSQDHKLGKEDWESIIRQALDTKHVWRHRYKKVLVIFEAHKGIDIILGKNSTAYRMRPGQRKKTEKQCDCLT